MGDLERHRAQGDVVERLDALAARVGRGAGVRNGAAFRRAPSPGIATVSVRLSAG
ncbi:protein of unknown function [Kyrpidia spormannii]|uniref:Uncharacterized protein n=1 Tax=Kyrpidia spormannii TaxID=2055160 RepID=A0ACA8ZEW3_9BACL|nr:protein of unknown function [Kyrpidia spormannii]